MKLYRQTFTKPCAISLGLALSLLALASPAQAYIGPGAGLTAIGAFIALVAAVIVSAVAFIWFPLRRMIRKMGAKSSPAGDVDSDDD